MLGCAVSSALGLLMFTREGNEALVTGVRMLNLDKDSSLSALRDAVEDRDLTKDQVRVAIDALYYCLARL